MTLKTARLTMQSLAGLPVRRGNKERKGEEQAEAEVKCHTKIRSSSICQNIEVVYYLPKDLGCDPFT